MKVTTTSDVCRRTRVARKANLLQQLQDMLPFCRGSIHAFRKPAGKKAARVGQTGRAYYNWERWIDGKRVSSTLRVDQVEHIRTGIAGYQAFTRLTQELADVMEQEHLAAPAWQATGRAVKKTNVSEQKRFGRLSRSAGKRRGKRGAAHLSRR